MKLRKILILLDGKHFFLFRIIIMQSEMVLKKAQALFILK